jgi:calcineurin-like phosphoesterase
VPTADAKILPGGTAYMTDLGMTGPYDSVLGRKKERVIQFMTTAMPVAFDVAEEDVRLCGVFIETDDATRRAVRCERIELTADPNAPPFSHEND